MSCYGVTGTKAAADWNILKHSILFLRKFFPIYLISKIRLCFRNSEVRHKDIPIFSVWYLIRWYISLVFWKPDTIMFPCISIYIKWELLVFDFYEKEGAFLNSSVVFCVDTWLVGYKLISMGSRYLRLVCHRSW